MPAKNENLGTLDDLIDPAMDSIGDSLRTLRDGMRRLETCGLTLRAIILLLHDQTGIGKRDIQKILEALPSLASHYLVENYVADDF